MNYDELMSLIIEGQMMRSSDLAEVMNEIRDNAHSIAARIKVIAYCAFHPSEHHLQEMLVQNLGWMITSCPEHPMFQVRSLLSIHRSDTLYPNLVSKWLQVLSRQDVPPLVVANAAEFFKANNDPVEAQRWMSRASQLEPTNPIWLTKLADFCFTLGESTGDSSMFLNAVVACRAANDLYASQPHSTDRALNMAKLPELSIASDDFTTAKSAALELLQFAGGLTDPDLRAICLYKAHIALGRVTANMQDIDMAILHLEDASNVELPTDFARVGIDFKLPGAILRAGFKKPVLEYLQKIEKYFPPKFIDELHIWSTMIQSDGIVVPSSWKA